MDRKTLNRRIKKALSDVNKPFDTKPTTYAEVHEKRRQVRSAAKRLAELMDEIPDEVTAEIKKRTEEAEQSKPKLPLTSMWGDVLDKLGI